MIELDNIRYQTVSVEEMLDQHIDMLKAHFKEAEHSMKDKSLSLDEDLFRKLSGNNMFCVVGAFDSTIDKLVGYAAFLIDKSFITNIFGANEIGLYVAPEYRKIGVASTILAVSEVIVKERGVEVMRLALKDKNVGMHNEIYNLGYELDELVFLKRI